MVRTKIATVLVSDDVSIERTAGRRGIAGTLIVEKIVGAAAEAGWDLASLTALGSRVNNRTRSIGVALEPCRMPVTGATNFSLGPGEIEFGVGIHGESGRERRRGSSADAIASDLLASILEELQPQAGEEALLLVNGFGATPLMELYVMMGSALAALSQRGIAPTRQLAGSFVTCLNMAGCSLTLSMLDAELRALWDAPVHTPSLSW
jgi:dihydroxyacetone kinase-like protein